MSQKDAIALRKAMLSSRRGELPAAEQALLKTLLKGESTDIVTPAVIPHRAEFSPAPLSFAQQQLWLMDQLKPGNAAYNIPVGLRLTGRLDVAVLEKSLNEIVRRHETLRTTFATRDGQPVQVIAPWGVMPLPVVDLRELGHAERQAEARRVAAREAQGAFDLKRGPLVRVTLLQWDEEDHLLFLTMHHVVSDGRSMEIFIQEMFALYHAILAAKPSPLSELPVQYADYAVWQRKRLSPKGDLGQGEALERQLAYWKKQLEGAPAVLELPADRLRPLVRTYRGATQSFMLPPTLVEALQALSQQERMTLFMTLLAALQVLLGRYTGREDIVVGSPVAGRNRAEIEGLIGYFVNMLVLRTDLSGNPTFRELLGRVREVALGAYAHQDVPFEMLVDALKPERSLGYSPLFQVAFALRNASTEAWEASGLNMEFWGSGEGTAKFDLTLAITEVKQGLWGALEYSTDLFDDATIRRLVGHCQVLLEGIVANPDLRLSDLPLLTEAEQHQVLVEWNEARAEYPQDRCIHELFEMQVERTPDALALVFEDMSLTFQELNRRANQLAHHLQALGVGSDTLVGLYVGRSLEMLVGILGILKAGGAYVPMNPSFPSERLAYMLDDTHVPVLLTQRRWVEQLLVGDYRVIRLDADWATIAQASGENLIGPVSPDNLAYVIYTSGSTGRPKGVTLSHANVCPLLYWGYKHMALTSDDRAIQYLSYCFDWAVLEIFITLTLGASLFIMSDDKMMDAEATLDLIARNKITVLHGTPTQFQFLIAMGQGLESIEYACIGAETLSLDLAERSHKLLNPRCRMYNVYGPTEAAISAATLEVDRWHLSRYTGLSSVPIGPPIANARCYVLDKHSQVQPIGVPGELYIAGDGVARGYWGRPGLTAEKFLPNPFRPRERVYRTGDLVRWLPDGTLEFLGRMDYQVKIRGFRVELAEIETLLRQHPGVQEAVVLARPKSGGKRPLRGNLELVAYVVGREGQEPMAGEIYRFLRDKLPGYMVPSAFVKLDTLPLTATGKLDRSALSSFSEMPDSHSWMAENYVAPRTPTEERLTSIWAQVLDIEQVGVTENFFELGGHSLLATQLISRLRQAFGVELPLRTLFEAPTVAGLAERVEMARRAKQNLPVPPIEPVTRDGELALSFAQQRLWFLDQLEPGSAFYNIPAAMRLTGQFNVAALERSLNEIAQRHEALRTTFAAVDGRPVQVIAPTLKVWLPVIDLEEYPVEEREAQARRLATEEAQRPFDLRQAPLVRRMVLQLGEKDHVLFLNMHHIISDGWSVGVLIRELAALYQAFGAGRPSPLPKLPIQYADFAIWQRQWLQGEVLETQLSYWKRQLGDALTVLELPTDRPRPPLQTYRGAIRSFVLSAPLTEALRALSRQEDVTLFMTLLAAFNVLLYRYTGQIDLLVGSPIANRNRAEIEGLIGFFVNTLVLRTDLSGNPTFRELLGRVCEVTLGAYAHQDLPFEMLVEALQPERDMSRNPLFQVMFVFQNAPMPVPELPGQTLSLIEVDSGTSRFDLLLSMTEAGAELSGGVEYNTDLFDAGTMARMMEHFQTLLEGIVANPDQQVSDITLLTEADRQMLIEWNDTQAGYPQNTCLHELFEIQAERTPDTVAVALEDQHLTYWALDRRANQLAHHLQALDVGSDAPVSLCLERSLEMAVGVLGTLKAGKAYLPIDPDYPEERIAFMLDDSGTLLLLTTEKAVKRFSFTSLQNLRAGNVTPVVTLSRSQIKDFDGLPKPNRTLVNYKEYHKYIGYGPVKHSVSLQISRGCPFNCLYCHKIWPKTHVVRSAKNVLEEICWCYKAGIKRFVFIDDIFNLNKRNSSELLQSIVRRGLEVQLFFPNGLRGDILTHDLIDLMVEAGTVNIDVALESASPRIQRLIQKNLNLERFRENVDYIIRKYPHVILEMEMMLGFPTETEAEALLTLDFLKGLEWVHFPNLNILKIYPNTNMHKFAVESGVSEELIWRSTHLAYHELPETLPFSKNFVRQYQARFMSEYFLNRERLLRVLPIQMRILTEDELVQKYDSYLPMAVKSFSDILQCAGIADEALGDARLLQDDRMAAPDFCEKISKHFPTQEKGSDALQVVLLDLSLLFSAEAENLLYNVIEAPLGLMYLMTYLDKRFGRRVAGKVAKSRIDFDSFDELKDLLNEYRPRVIGIRTLSLYKDFFHKAVSLMKQWYPDVPIITGGPYATSEYATILADKNVDVVVLGEGEATFSELIGKIVENGGKLPGDEVLGLIAGLAFVPRQRAGSRERRDAGREILMLDRMAEKIVQGEIEAPEKANDATDLCYVMYTSGSTGKPKGVAMRHGSLVNLMQWQAQTTALRQPVRTLQFASLSFDVACQEMFFTWSSGGTLILTSDEVRRDASMLLQVLDEACVERLFLPFVALQHLAQVADDPQARVPAKLREIITAGEQLQITRPIKRFFDALEGGVLHNQYGPTESHVVTAFTLRETPEVWTTLPPIGRPIANATIYILNQRLRLMPIGAPGELHIGGRVLARGYFNRPDLTAERFSPDPFSREPGARLYRTGDLARYQPDGNIEFLGRVDRQVKVRGYRIELGEIEAVLSQHPAVREAVVLVQDSKRVPGGREASLQDRQSPSGDLGLVAYVVTHEGQTLMGSELRGFLKEKLPEYMIPSALALLKALPLTPSGKVDRRALPAPEKTYLGLTGAQVAPRDALELRLIQIWQDLLDVQPIGVKQSFFELGGHSLLAVRLMARIQRELGLQLPVATLFQSATVEHLASVLRRHKETAILSSSLVNIQVGDSNQRPLFLVHPGGGNVLCYVDLVHCLGPGRPCYGLQAHGLDDKQTPLASVEAMADHYVALLRAVQPGGPYLLGGWSMGGIVAFEMARQLQAQGQSVALLALIDSRAPTGRLEPEPDDTTLLMEFARGLGLPMQQIAINLDHFQQLARESQSEKSAGWTACTTPGASAAWGPLPLDFQTSFEEQLAWVLGQAKQADVVPPDIELTQVRRLFHVFRCNIQAMQSYVPRAYSGPITLFKAGEHSDMPDKDLGWCALAVGGIIVHQMPGNHYTIIRKPNVEILARQLEQELNQAESAWHNQSE